MEILHSAVFSVLLLIMACLFFGLIGTAMIVCALP